MINTNIKTKLIFNYATPEYFILDIQKRYFLNYSTLSKFILKNRVFKRKINVLKLKKE